MTEEYIDTVDQYFNVKNSISWWQDQLEWLKKHKELYPDKEDQEIIDKWIVKCEDRLSFWHGISVKTNRGG